MRMQMILAFQHSAQVLTPLQPKGLTRTQLGRQRLLSRYKDAELLYEDGSIRRIAGIELGPYIDSVLPFPFRWITTAGLREIKLSLAPAERADINRVKRQTLQYLKTENHLEDWVQKGETAEELLKNVEEAASIGDLFAALHLDSDEEGLDVLS